MLRQARRLHAERSAPDRIAAAVGQDLDRECERWNRGLARLGELLDDEAAGRAVLPFIEQRWLERQQSVWEARCPGTFPYGLRPGFGPTALFPGALVVFFHTTPPALRVRVALEGVREPQPKPDGFVAWGRRWVDNLAKLRSRLPADLDPGLMRALLALRLDRPGEVADHALGCTGCGLERPVRRFTGWENYKPDFYTDGCP